MEACPPTSLLGHGITVRTDRWIRRTTGGSAAVLAVVAGIVSYLHIHLLVELHGQPGWVAALTPLSLDGMIVAASTTLLADSRSGSRVAVVAVAGCGKCREPCGECGCGGADGDGSVVAAWSSFALIGSYELLMRQVRAAAAVSSASSRQPIRDAVIGSGLPGAPASRPRSSTPSPAASRCRAAAFSCSSSASSCAEPRCSTSRDPRRDECTISHGRRARRGLHRPQIQGRPSTIRPRLVRNFSNHQDRTSRSATYAQDQVQFVAEVRSLIADYSDRSQYVIDGGYVY